MHAITTQKIKYSVINIKIWSALHMHVSLGMGTDTRY